MSVKKPPSDEPQPSASAQLDVLFEALATVTAKLQGLEGKAITKHVHDVQTAVHSLIATTDLKIADEATRKVAAEEVERLVDSFTKLGTSVGDAAAKYRQPILAAFRGVEVGRMAEGLRLLADWLLDPSDDAAQKVQDVIANLQKTMGPLVGWDPARVDRERQAAIKKDVAASLEAIFGPNKPD